MRDFNRTQSVEIGLSLDDETGLISGLVDPSQQAPMLNVPMSTLYLRLDPPQVWQKTGVSDTAYTQLTGNGGTSGEIDLVTVSDNTFITYLDPIRNKTLSTSFYNYVWHEAHLINNDWLSIGEVKHINVGHIMPINATITGYTIQCIRPKNNIKPLALFVDDVNMGDVATISGSNEYTYFSGDLDIDVSQGQKLRIRAGGGGKVDGVIFNLSVRWRVS